MNITKKSLALSATLLFSAPLSVLAADVTIKCPTPDEINDFKCEEKSCERKVITTVDVTKELQIPLTWTSKYYSSKTNVSSLSKALINANWDLVCTYEDSRGTEVNLKTSDVTGHHTCTAKNDDNTHTHEFINCDEEVLSKKQ